MASRFIIAVANELGYFPTDRQSTEINCRSAELYHTHPDCPLTDAVDDVLFNWAVASAAEEVMKPKRRSKS